jgi:hypothetical protein
MVDRSRFALVPAEQADLGRPAGKDLVVVNLRDEDVDEEIPAIDDALQLGADDDVRADHHIVAPDHALKGHPDLDEFQPLDPVLLLLELLLDLVDVRLVLPQAGVHVGQLDRDLVLALARVGHVVAPVADEHAATHRLELAVEALELRLGDPVLPGGRGLGGAGGLDLAPGDDATSAEGCPPLELRVGCLLLGLVDADALADHRHLLLDAADARLLKGRQPLREVVAQAPELLALDVQRLEAVAGRLELGGERGRDRAVDPLVADRQERLALRRGGSDLGRRVLHRSLDRRRDHGEARVHGPAEAREAGEGWKKGKNGDPPGGEAPPGRGQSGC